MREQLRPVPGIPHRRCRAHRIPKRLFAFGRGRLPGRALERAKLAAGVCQLHGRDRLTERIRGNDMAGLVYMRRRMLAPTICSASGLRD
jgi:hypothetical protein